ncbi:hypothetical protein DSECCO2_661580 [anaerobic digester metagenome]
MIHDYQSIAETFRFVEIVRGEDKGVPCRLEAPEFLPDQVPRLWVEPDGGLVEDEQFRCVDQGPGDDQTPFHSAREFVDQDIPFLLKLHECEEFFRPLLCLPLRDAEVAGVDQQVSVG